MSINNVATNKRIPWEQYTVLDTHATGFLANTGGISVSAKMLDVMLSYERFRMYQSTNEAGKLVTGYGYTNPNENTGPTESEASTHWRKAVFAKQKSLIVQLPVRSISQSQFDALLSLYFSTGSWRTVQGTSGLYNIERAIKANQWKLVADMIANGSADSSRRLKEARALVLADYDTSQDRIWMLRENRGHTVTAYTRGLLDATQLKQVEVAYYREYDTFLPNMSKGRKARVIRLGTTTTEECDC